ncbi:MAG: hypothetical protein WC614_07265 [bacterium]
MEEKTTNISRPKEVTIVAILLFALAVWGLVSIFSTKIQLEGNEALMVKAAGLLGGIVYLLLGFGILKMINWVRMLTVVIFILGLAGRVYNIITHGFKLTDMWLILDIAIIVILLLKSTKEAFNNKIEIERNKRVAATLKIIREKKGTSLENEK